MDSIWPQWIVQREGFYLMLGMLVAGTVQKLHRTTAYQKGA